MQPTGNQPAATGAGTTPRAEFEPPRLVPLGRVTDLTKEVSGGVGTDFFTSSG